MKKKVLAVFLLSVLLVSSAQAYLIQGLDLEIAYWAGFGSNETVVVIDWNDTNGPYTTAYHVFGFRWDDPQATVKDALVALEAAGPLSVTYAYGGGFIGDIIYDQTMVDGDYHYVGPDYFGWWWAGDTTDGGTTWTGNADGIDIKLLRNGVIEGFTINGFDWGGHTITIPEPATLVLLGAGLAVLRFRKQ